LLASLPVTAAELVLVRCNRPPMALIVLAIAAVVICSAIAHAKFPAVSLSGGDGSSFAKAIVVKASTDHAGVNAQHDYIAKHFGKWRYMASRPSSTTSVCSIL
jgi:hypothetical protein